MNNKEMNKLEALEAIKLLSQEFKIIEPNLVWSLRAINGLAYGSKYSIVIGPKCWRGVEPALLHEFAHIVTYRKNHVMGHRELFWQILTSVCQAWYGSNEKYPWDTEYKHGQVFHGRRGS